MASFPTSVRAPRWLRACSLALLLLAGNSWAAVTVAINTNNATPTVGGGAFVYTVTVNNPDGVTANNLALSLPLPPGIQFLSLAVSGTGAGSFSCVQPAVSTNGQIFCRAPSLAAAATATFAATVQVQDGLAAGVRTATTRLTVGTTETTSSVQTNQQVTAPLAVSLAGPGSAQAGSRLSYTLTLNNGGTSTTINSVVTGVLPAGFSHFSAQGTRSLADSCDYLASTRTLTCSGLGVDGASKLTWTVESSPSMAPGPVQVNFTISNAGTGTIAVGSASVMTTIN